MLPIKYSTLSIFVQKKVIYTVKLTLIIPNVLSK